jgi:hypothetical protein
MGAAGLARGMLARHRTPGPAPRRPGPGRAPRPTRPGAHPEPGPTRPEPDGRQPDRPQWTTDTRPPPTLYSPPVRPADICSCGRVKPADRRGELDIVAKLSTLIGLDDDPAMMSGWGPVLADIARRAAFEEQANPHWKWSLTDENGLLLHHGHTGAAPPPPKPRSSAPATGSAKPKAAAGPRPPATSTTATNTPRADPPTEATSPPSANRTT